MINAGDLESPEICSCGFESHRPHHVVKALIGLVKAWPTRIGLRRSFAGFAATQTGLVVNPVSVVRKNRRRSAAGLCRKSVTASRFGSGEPMATTSSSRLTPSVRSSRRVTRAIWLFARGVALAAMAAAGTSVSAGIRAKRRAGVVAVVSVMVVFRWASSLFAAPTTRSPADPPALPAGSVQGRASLSNPWGRQASPV